MMGLLKTFATEILPKLKDRLAEVQALSEIRGVNGSRASSPPVWLYRRVRFGRKQKPKQ